MVVSTAASTALVFALLSLLGSPRYRDRELAQAALQRMMPLAEEYLRTVVDSETANVEQHRRCTLLLKRYFRDRAEMLAGKLRPVGWAELPWIDSLPLDYPHRNEVIGYYLDCVRRTQPSTGAPWPDYREATRLFLVTILSEPRTFAQAAPLLEQMAIREAEWVRAYGAQHTPPVVLPLVKQE